MKTIKQIFIIFLILIILGLVISLFLPANIKIQKQIVIKAPKNEVFNQVVQLKNWVKWHNWQKVDSNIVIKYNDTAQSATQYKVTSISWESKNDSIDNGKVEMDSVVKGQQIKFKYIFHKNKFSDYIWDFKDTTDNSTNVKLTWIFHLGENPVKKLFGALVGYESIFAPIAENTLNQLDDYEHTQPHLPPIETVNIKNANLMLAFKDTIPNDSLHVSLLKDFDKLKVYTRKNKINIIESPVVIYDDYTENYNVVEVGVVIKDSVQVGGKMFLRHTPKGKAIKLTHKGGYAGLKPAYQAMFDWMKQNSVIPSGSPWEVYLNGPEATPDSTKWVTTIYYPL